MLLLPLLFSLQDTTPFVARPLTVAVGEGMETVTTVCGSPSKDYILEVNGGGLVVGDFDADGAHDLIVIDGSTLERARADEPGLPPRLLLNDGAGGFRQAPEPWGMAGGRWGTGGAAGDVDGDGDLDLVVTEWGADRLFLNDAHGGFVEATDTAGLRGRAWGTSAALLDYDRDGQLDLTVINYLSSRLDDIDDGTIASRESGQCRWKGLDVMCGPEGLDPLHDRLYRGGGDGTFADVSVAAGYRPQRAGFGLGVTTADYDADGDTDLYVTNDSTPNFLWENQGDGTFVEVGERRRVAQDMNGKEQAGMGIAVADLNADGFSDYFVTNFSGESNALYLSRPSPRRLTYNERASQVRVGGPSIPYLGWGTGFADFDHDGDLDLFVLNGHVYPQADGVGTDTTYAQADQLFRNVGTAEQPRFELEALDASSPRVSRAGAPADIDGDGDLDLFAVELDGSVHVLENVGAEGHWLRVRLRGRGGNTEAIGARVELVEGDRSIQREIRTSGGFQAGIPAEAHFGLGANADAVDLRVHWPSGVVSVHEELAVDAIVTLDEPAEESMEDEE
ncbi:MAG: CRTAC1 family protein [Planctomycetota bacterium]|jgi:hypothetical protein